MRESGALQLADIDGEAQDEYTTLENGHRHTPMELTDEDLYVLFRELEATALLRVKHLGPSPALRLGLDERFYYIQRIDSGWLVELISSLERFVEITR